MKITLTTALKPDQRIQSIKALRAATGYGLRESKDIVDALCGFAPRPQEVTVYDDADMAEFGLYFVYAAPTPEDINRQNVLNFVLDVLAHSDPATAQRIMALPSYQRIADALR